MRGLPKSFGLSKKVIGKVVWFGLVGLLLLAGAGAGLLYFHQDSVIQLFVNQANQHLKTKVAVQRISLSLFRTFPHVAITLHEVTLRESIPGSKEPLLQAKQLYFTFNARDLLAGRYSVREAFLEEGRILLKTLPDGRVNYLVVAPEVDPKTTVKFNFHLQKITLKNVTVRYANQRQQQFYGFRVHQGQAALRVTDEKIAINATGKARVQALQIEGSEYFKNRDIGWQTSLTVNRRTSQIWLQPSEVNVAAARYQVAGTAHYAGSTTLNLTFTGKNTTLPALLALLPAKFSQPFGHYQSRGNVYFNGTVKGVTSGKSNPQVLVQFGCRNVSFYDPRTKQQLKDLSLTGRFSNGARQNSFTSVLELKQVRGRLKNKPFTGSIIYQNFRDPFLRVKLKADVEVAQLLAVLPVPGLTGGSGRAVIDMAIAGKLRSFRAQSGAEPVVSAGEISLRNVSLRVKNYPPLFHQLTGHFTFRQSDLVVTDFKGKLGQSDFLLNGYFKNVLGWLFLSGQKLRVEADFGADLLDFNQLLRENPGVTSQSLSAARRPATAAYKLTLSPNLDFTVNATVRRLQFRRFKGKNMHGTLRLKNQVLSSPALAVQLMGGRLAVNGFLDARRPNNLKVTTRTAVDAIHLDSLFYVCENFGQQFLVQRHLRGELTATIHSDLYFDSHLKAQTDRTEAEIEARIRHGRLINFEPMQKLAPFIPKRELADLHFPELSNTFWIQERTVYIPEMEVRSNVAKAAVIGVQGTHTFDQQLNYQFRVPLRTSTRQAGLSSPNAAGPNLFLTLKGREDNYRLAYDKERVRNKISQDLQREKQEFKATVKGKTHPARKKETTPQPAEDEYFNF